MFIYYYYFFFLSKEPGIIITEKQKTTAATAATQHQRDKKIRRNKEKSKQRPEQQLQPKVTQYQEQNISSNATNSRRLHPTPFPCLSHNSLPRVFTVHISSFKHSCIPLGSNPEEINTKKHIPVRSQEIRCKVSKIM